MYIHTHIHTGTQETADMTQETSEGRTILQLIGTKTSHSVRLISGWVMCKG